MYNILRIQLELQSGRERKGSFNPSTPMSDQDRISPNNINTTSNRQVMRIKKNISLGIINSSKTKFSKLTSEELYSRQ